MIGAPESFLVLDDYPSLRRDGVVHIFLSSPSDVMKERRLVIDLCRRLNDTVAREMGLTIDLLTWENRSGRFGRPQDGLNDLVDRSDLFIGLLHRTIGTDAGKGRTGFEEEFDRAVARRRHSNSPEVLMFFKEVSAAEKADPGVKLRRVLEFRKEVERRRELTYKAFSNAAEWQVLVLTSISEWLARAYLVRGGRRSRDPRAPGAAGEVTTATLPAMRSRLDTREFGLLVPALAGMTETERLVLILDVVGDLTIAESAQCLGMSPQDVFVMWSRAVAGLSPEERDVVCGSDPVWWTTY